MADVTDQGMNAPSPPFAVADDLANRWHAFQESEIPHIDAVLADASDLIVTQCPRWRETSEATLKRITCAVAKRALLNEDTGGVTSPRRPPEASPKASRTRIRSATCTSPRPN